MAGVQSLNNLGILSPGIRQQQDAGPFDLSSRSKPLAGQLEQLFSFYQADGNKAGRSRSALRLMMGMALR
jgi:hypothetical protein